MKIDVVFEQSDVDAIKNVYQSVKENPGMALAHRLDRNMATSLPMPSRDLLWRTIVDCLLTTQQRSGENSNVHKLLRSEDFPFTWAKCAEQENLGVYAAGFLKSFRRNQKIPKAIEYNFKYLLNGGWEKLESWAMELIEFRGDSGEEAQKRENRAADLLEDALMEIGPKQARNFWQILGLTRYTFVLDSRIMNWVRLYIINHPLLTNEALKDHDYYQYVSSLLYTLCEKADVVPCVFDGAVFDWSDRDEAKQLKKAEKTKRGKR